MGIINKKIIILHLCEVSTLGIIARIECPIKDYHKRMNIRLLAPRQGISCFLVAMNYSLELFCEYRLKLYHLKTLETSLHRFDFTYQRDDLWMLYGTNSTILSVRVDFSKCPALQL